MKHGRNLWDQKAAFWDALHGETGNIFHRKLISPPVERLLNLKSGERVLDVACGNGVMARRLAALGGQVTAVDFSPALIALARQRGGAIDYRVVDATDETALNALGQYPAIVCTMALMDIPVIAPLFRAVRRMLEDGGRFVFATAHPAFNSNNPIRSAEMDDQNGALTVTHTLKIAAYLDVPPYQGIGAPNEPNPHFYYHRPLHQLLGEAFAAGLVLDGIEEPALRPEDVETPRLFSWEHYPQFPAVLVGRLR